MKDNFQFSIFNFQKNLNARRYTLDARSGFTLMELLVVISVIAILIGLGISSYSTAQKKGRDAKRKTDVKDIQNALEQYYSVCNYQYPTASANSIFSSIACSNPNITILATVPSDPRTTPYYCSGDCTTSNYTVCATMETESSAFCVTNKQ